VTQIVRGQLSFGSAPLTKLLANEGCGGLILGSEQTRKQATKFPRIRLDGAPTSMRVARRGLDTLLLVCASGASRREARVD
jgi:hypothetical protein